MSKKCPICSKLEVTLVQNEIQGNVKTNVYRCETCDLDFLETWDDVEHVKSLYEGDKYVFSHNVSNNAQVGLKFNEYDARYAWVKPFLGKDKSLLEIGCGDGKFLRMVKDDVCIAEGCELSPPQVKKLRREGFTCYDKMVDEMPPPQRYDIVCMFALLEHVPLISSFLEKLKDYIHEGSHIFIEVPNLNNPLVSGVSIQEFKAFYYRPIHLYYFTPSSLVKLLAKAGYESNVYTSQQASITNHFHWMHNRCGQSSANYMTSVVLPVSTSKKLPMGDIFEKVDDYYRSLLNENQMGDLLSAHVFLPGTR